MRYGGVEGGVYGDNDKSPPGGFRMLLLPTDVAKASLVRWKACIAEHKDIAQLDEMTYYGKIRGGTGGRTKGEGIPGPSADEERDAGDGLVKRSVVRLGKASSVHRFLHIAASRTGDTAMCGAGRWC